MALQQVARVGLPARLPSAFRCHVGMAPTSAAGSVPGDTLPPALPRALPPRWGEARELGNTLGSRAGTPTGPTTMAGGHGAATESTPTRAATARTSTRAIGRDASVLALIPNPAEHHS